MSKYNCLVVEDSPMMRQLLGFALARIDGLDVIEADDGIDGLKKIGKHMFDLVVVDINMPVMDGLKLIKRIRDDETHKNVPIIIITTETADEERARKLGANVYLTKPVAAPEVLKVAKKLLGIVD